MYKVLLMLIESWDSATHYHSSRCCIINNIVTKLTRPRLTWISPIKWYSSSALLSPGLRLSWWPSLLVMWLQWITILLRGNIKHKTACLSSLSSVTCLTGRWWLHPPSGGDILMERWTSLISSLLSLLWNTPVLVDTAYVWVHPFLRKVYKHF